MEVVLKGVHKQYGQTPVVKDLNLHIKEGSLHFLLGPSGCGKTTTLRMLAGLETVSSGKVLFSGQDVTNLPPGDRNIGMVFQNYALWPHMTVRQNIEYGLKIKKLESKEIKKRLAETLAITQLDAFQSRLPNQLSGGQQQRVALARALAMQPKVLLLDEPLSNLDTQLRLEIRDNIAAIHDTLKITTIYVTHDQKEALSIGTHITVMLDGREMQTGTPRDLYLYPKNPFIAQFIGETNLISGEYLSAEDQGHKVSTSFGNLYAGRSVQSFKKGDKVTLSIRPEAVQLANLTEDKQNLFNAQICNKTYLGDLEQLRLKIPNGQTLNSNIYNVDDADFSIGNSLSVSPSPNDVLILPSGA